MSEQTTQEQQLPSKEELMAFLQEQIDVKKLQVELQELNTRLAKGKAEELQALSFVAQITNPQAPPPDAQPHVITEEDMEQNPTLAEQGFKVGDEVLVTKEETKQRSLKKTK
jgi:hypothetical protein